MSMYSFKGGRKDIWFWIQNHSRDPILQEVQERARDFVRRVNLRDGPEKRYIFTQAVREMTFAHLTVQGNFDFGPGLVEAKDIVEMLCGSRVYVSVEVCLDE